MSWWEDVKIGTRRELGCYTFTEGEIIRFAKKYDPQIFHLDPEAAKQKAPNARSPGNTRRTRPPAIHCSARACRRASRT